jgi:AraC family transcriptional activator FtrA
MIDQIMPTAKSARRVRNPLVVALVYDGLCAFEFSCAAEVFGLSRPELGPEWYRFETCSKARSVRAQYGMRMMAANGLERLQAAGTIVIPGWEGIDVPVPHAILDALRGAHARGARLLSICSGAFVLAATGLLDGRRATTHWRYAEALQRRYPEISVDANVLYVDEGSVLTSAGSAAGLDLCLHLVVIPPHRDGGQAQFLERPVEDRARGAEPRGSLSARPTLAHH